MKTKIEKLEKAWEAIDEIWQETEEGDDIEINIGKIRWEMNETKRKLSKNEENNRIAATNIMGKAIKEAIRKAMYKIEFYTGIEYKKTNDFKKFQKIYNEVTEILIKNKENYENKN